MLGPVNDRHTSVLQGNANKAAGIIWNGRITARMKTEEKQDARLKASRDTDIVQRCRQALSRWNEKVMCVCLCAGWGLGGRRGMGGRAAVSNGSCLTGKRSICYNVNNDLSSYCAARDKSIKDPSCPIIAILCQQPAEGTRVTEREKRKWGRILERQLFLQSCFAEQLFLLWNKMLVCSGRPVLPFSLLYSFWHAHAGYLLWSICSSMESVWEWSDLLAAALITH